MDKGKPSITDHDKLINLVKQLSPIQTSDSAAVEAASNLLSFVELLLEIDHEHSITRASYCEVQL